VGSRTDGNDRIEKRFDALENWVIIFETFSRESFFVDVVRVIAVLLLIVRLFI